jgi:galactokinase
LQNKYERVIDLADVSEVTDKIKSGKFDSIFSSIYWPDESTLKRQRDRYVEAISGFEENYGKGRDITIYSVPGRVEICGNHTDHNNGIVMAAAINLDIVAVASKSDKRVIRVRSKGFGDEDVVHLSELEPDGLEAGRSSAMIRGVSAGFVERGVKIAGFDAYTVSDVMKGSGLSSSAAFEICIGTILNREYNNNRLTAIELGIVGQFAENIFFGKPSGLMDQISCSVGGAISIDFRIPSEPFVTKFPFNLSSYGLKLVVTDTKGNHADLTDEYSARRGEMERAAGFFDKRNLRDVQRDVFFSRIPSMRSKIGDRAVLRAIHFYEECERVGKSIDAVRRGDIPYFLSLIVESGNSSFEYNQNAYCAKDPDHQGVPLGLALSQTILNGQGAWRLQGGGFAGTIQAFVPDILLERYCEVIRGVFGGDACHILQVREEGALKVA